MRPLAAIGITFIAAVGVDIGLGLLRPQQWLPITVCAAIGDLGTFASLFVVPGLFIFPPFKTRALHSLALRAFLAVLLSWFLTIAFRMHFSLPALRAMARLRNDNDYDGIGGNAAVFVGGWILPLIITVIMVIVEQSRLVGRNSHGTSASSNLPDIIADTEDAISE